MSFFRRASRRIQAAFRFAIDLLLSPLRGLQEVSELWSRGDETGKRRGDSRHSRHPGLIRRMGWGCVDFFLGLWNGFAGFWMYLTAPGRRLRSILVGLFLLACLSIGIIVTRSFLKDPAERQAAIASSAAAALKQGDVDRAISEYEQLVEEVKDQPRYRYELALAKEQKSGMTAAFSDMEMLAPTTDGGYAPAHRWMVERLVKVTPEQLLSLGLDPTQRSHRLQHHVDVVLSESPDDFSMLLLKAEFEKVARPEEAIRIYQQLAATEPRMLFQVAVLQRRLRQADAATKTYRQINELMQERLDSGKFAAIDVQDFLASSLMLAEYDSAWQTLEKYADALPSSKATELRAQILLALAAQDVMSSDKSLQRQGLDRIVASIQLEPGNSESYRLLGYFAQLNPDHPDLVVTACQSLIAEQPESPDVHLFLGGLLLGMERFDVAEGVLNEGLALYPTSAELLNNLAWLYSNRAEQDLTKAKELSDQSIELKPSNPSFYETRGSILVKQGELEAALADFERAMQGMPNSEKLVEELADVYQELGYESQAKAYRQRLEKIRQQQSPQ